MGDVVSPRASTYSVTCHEWLVHGVWTRRTLPTIWNHMCSVAAVSLQASRGKLGHVASRSAAGGISGPDRMMTHDQRDRQSHAHDVHDDDHGGQAVDGGPSADGGQRDHHEVHEEPHGDTVSDSRGDGVPDQQVEV